VGLRLVRDGEARPSPGATSLLCVRSTGEAACEFCGRDERMTFFGRHRPLSRMRCVELGSVICADCLDHGGELINTALRR
jgi:hypothetical protein